jgi:glycosyltransferase involved in cell wall biosynthesis
MRILYFAPRECWPLTTGARLRDYHLAREMASRCEVTLVCLHDPGEPDPEPPPRGAGFAQYLCLNRERGYRIGQIAAGLLGPAPLPVRNYSSASASAALSRLIAEQRFDSIQLEGVHLLSYLPVLRAAAGSPALIVDWHNIESELMRRYRDASSNPVRKLAAGRTATLLERAEDQLLAAAPVHTVCSERERVRLSDRAPGAAVSVIPNGVDLAYYAGAGRASAAGDSVVFVGSMDYHANIEAAAWFAGEVWPELRRRGVRRFVIAGRNPAPAVRKLAGGGVEVTGTLHDIRTVYAGAAAAVVPLRVGGGTRLKILEAMAAGVPVVATHLAAEGLGIDPGTHYLPADTAPQMVESLERLRNSEETRSGLVRAALELVRGQYDWPRIGERLYSLHVRAVETQSRDILKQSLE